MLKLMGPLRHLKAHKKIRGTTIKNQQPIKYAQFRQSGTPKLNPLTKTRTKCSIHNMEKSNNNRTE